MTPPRVADEDAPAIGLPADLARLLSQDPVEATDGEITDAVGALIAGIDALECALTSWLDAFDGKTIWAGDGSRSAGAWLAARAELGRAAATAKVHQARELRACPVLSAAYRDNRLGTAKVRAALRARQAWPELFAEHEATIVAEIEPLTVDEAMVVLNRWATLAAQLRASREEDAGGGDGDGEGRHPAAGNALHLSTTFGGTVVGDLTLDPAAGAELTEAVDARVDHLFETGVFRSDDGLSRAARRAWALRDLVDDGTRPSSRQGKPRPSVTLVLDERTAAGEPVADVEDLRSRRCELAGGIAVPRSVAERLLCTCTLTALVRRTLADGQIEVVGVTDTLRDATWRQRAALAQRDGGCIFPGCDTAPERCQAHHLHHYEDGGETLLHNLVLLCSFHHHLVHEGGWKLARQPDDTLRLAKPNGTVVPLTPQGHKLPSASPPPRARQGP